MTEDEKFAVSARLYVQLRRKIGRVIDTVWMVQNAEYAREVLRLARNQGDAEIMQLAGRFEELMSGVARQPQSEQEPLPATTSKYIGSLR